jgi:hypothetical protein
MTMHVYALNKPIFEFAPDHPARRFLEAFVRCRQDCVGREMGGVDQEWLSETSGRDYSFSSFAYEYLSFDVELDGWLQNAPDLTDSEKAMLAGIAQIEELMAECTTVAIAESNSEVVTMCEQVVRMCRLWNECIDSRLRAE